MLEGGILQLKVRKGSCSLKAHILVCEPTNNNNYKLSHVTKQMVHSDVGRAIVTPRLLLLDDQRRSLWRADRLMETWRRRRRHQYKESVDIGKGLGCVVRQRHRRSKKNMNEKWGRCDLSHQLHSWNGVNGGTCHNAAEEVLLNSHMTEGGSCQLCLLTIHFCVSVLLHSLMALMATTSTGISFLCYCFIFQVPVASFPK